MKHVYFQSISSFVFDTRNMRKHFLHNGNAYWCGKTCQCILCKFSVYIIAKSIFNLSNRNFYWGPKLYSVLGNNAIWEDSYFLSPRMNKVLRYCYSQVAASGPMKCKQSNLPEIVRSRVEREIKKYPVYGDHRSCNKDSRSFNVRWSLTTLES